MANKKNILIIDDSELISNSIRLLLERENYKVFYEPNPSTATNVLLKNDISLIILDLMMPKITGEEYIFDLKNDPKTANIPVIILSAKLKSVVSDQTLNFCDIYMEKPFNNKNLVSNVKKCLKKK